jgi:hypothetical protein
MAMADVDREELKDLMRDILQELLWEMEQELPDPDAGLDIRPEIAEQLLKFRQERPSTKSFEEVTQALGIDLDE